MNIISLKRILIKEIAQNYTIDAIVNNVGMAMPAFQFLEQTDLQELEVLLDLNVRTAIQITQAFITPMKTQHWGRIINISSRAVFGVKGLGNYAAAKSALLGLTKTWALELAAFGVTVNAISPGAIETDLFRQKRPIGSEAEQNTMATIPMKRIGQPCEILLQWRFCYQMTQALIQVKPYALMAVVALWSCDMRK